MKRLLLSVLGGMFVLAGSSASAKPIGPAALCDIYPDSPVCSAGVPDCSFCHLGTPPARNAFGTMLESELLPAAPRPLSTADFVGGLGTALQAIEGQDADGDGTANIEEILAGSWPGDPRSFPRELGCTEGGTNPDFDVCAYDPKYVFKKVMLDFCGRSPSWDEMQDFLAAGNRKDTLHTTLDACLKSEFWIGQNGQLWRIAHNKIKPLQALKAGEDAGPIPLGDYYDDYALFVYTQTGDHDAREVLTADFFVTRKRNPTRYEIAGPSDGIGEQGVDQEYRAGMLTTRWNFVLNTMFTAVPRTTAAQALRSFVGIDIAKLQGLEPVQGEPVDWDEKGVQAPACAVCHSTLDPATYPFTTYQGLTGDIGTYDPERIQRNFRNEGANILDMPESGVLLGQPVANLMEWADVAANSDQFAEATVRDYWSLLMGRERALPEHSEEYKNLWQTFRGPQVNYRVETMLHHMIETEAYGVP